MRAYRITKARHQDSAFGGHGAREYGGRWNSPGRAVVYLSGSIALAALEVLVHTTERAGLLEAFVSIEVEFEEELLQVLDAGSLPAGWNSFPEPASTKRIGDAWIDSRSSALLAVPSAVVPQEANLLLNPLHPDFTRVVRGEPQAFVFDLRIR